MVVFYNLQIQFSVHLANITLDLSCPDTFSAKESALVRYDGPSNLVCHLLCDSPVEMHLSHLITRANRADLLH